MYITFLIGNGFDLNLGLKTGYKDFLEVYTSRANFAKIKDDSILSYFKNEISENEDLWSDAELAFGQLTSKFKSDNKNAEDFSECHEDFCIKLSKYLIEQENRINYANLKEITSKALYNALQNYLNYFREVENEQIKSSYINIEEEYVYNFLNFNYTKTLNQCISALKNSNISLGLRTCNGRSHSNKLGNIINVHGTVNRDMVFGVGDKSQIAMPSLFDGYSSEYINQIIKSEIDKDNKENTYKKAFNVLDNSKLIYIYGMSIGETDKLWWEKICALMHEQKKLNIIIHMFDAPKSPLIRRKYTTFENQVRERFLSFSNLDKSQKNDISRRIHIDGSNIFSGLTNLVENSKNVFEKELVASSK